MESSSLTLSVILNYYCIIVVDVGQRKKITFSKIDNLLLETTIAPFDKSERDTSVVFLNI